MREVGVLEAKTNLSALLDSVERGGEDVLITRHGKPVARLSAAQPAEPRRGKPTGAELLARSRALRERIARETPEMADVSWEDLKAEMRR